MQRVPYKQIGAKLGKTDLACRLHFHQMLTAKRSPETQPGRSIVFLSSEHSPEVHRLLPRNSNVHGGLPYVPHVGDLLPPSATALSLAVQPPPMHHRARSFPGMSPESGDLWQTLEPSYPVQNRNVDLNKLEMIYNECRMDFWSTVAAKYAGAQVSASELEQAFFRRGSVSEPIRPSITHHDRGILPSSNGTVWNHLPPLHSRRHSAASLGKCSVESLLNHNH